MSTTESLVGHWINGKTATSSGRTADVYDPATGQVARQVALASAADVDGAVRAAREAFAGWSTTSLSGRTAVMFAFRELLAVRAGELAALVTAEHVKTLEDARGEVQRGLEVVEFACAIAHLMKGEASEAIFTRVDTASYRQPLDVVAGITPFNFPGMVPMWMFPLALACGDAFVLKPSERDPSASLFMARLLPVRRPARPRPRGRALLHAGQGRHRTVAREGLGRRLRLPDAALSREQPEL